MRQDARQRAVGPKQSHPSFAQHVGLLVGRRDRKERRLRSQWRQAAGKMKKPGGRVTNHCRVAHGRAKGIVGLITPKQAIAHC
jgi:uncharacterized protein YjbJ (UPF0337 family)